MTSRATMDFRPWDWGPMPLVHFLTKSDAVPIKQLVLQEGGSK
jgi:hypothetical protein